MRSISIVRSLYFKIFSASFLITYYYYYYLYSSLDLKCIKHDIPFINTTVQSLRARLLSRYSDWATGWTVRGSNPGGVEIFRACPDRPWGLPASCTVGTGSFQGVKFGRDVLLTTNSLLVLWSWKSRAIPLPNSGPHRACNVVTLPLPLPLQYKT
jgi:hypothetical protein